MADSARASLERVVAEPGGVVWRALRRFLALSVLVMLVVLSGVWLVITKVAHDETVDQARLLNEYLTAAVATSLVDQDLRTGDPDARRRLTESLSTYLDQRGAFSHIVIWDLSGRAIWADQPERRDDRVVFSGRLQRAVDADRSLVSLPGAVDAGTLVPDGDERGPEADLVEVYTPATDADGRPFVVEAYLAPGMLSDRQEQLFGELIPLVAGGLLLLQAAILPLAWSLARRVDHERGSRSDLLRRALLFWHDERRQLAQELHDGVIQDLSAAGYALPLVRRAIPAGETEATETALQLEQVLQRDARAVRSLIYDLVPSDLGGGLVPALEALVERHRDDGAPVHLDLPAVLDLDHTVATMAYRVVREGLRNVDKHAAATLVTVRVTVDHGQLDVLLVDDGAGLRGRAAPRPSARVEDHVGMRLLTSLVADLGGELELVDGRDPGNGPGDASAGGPRLPGATLHLRLPVRLA